VIVCTPPDPGIRRLERYDPLQALSVVDSNASNRLKRFAGILTALALAEGSSPAQAPSPSAEGGEIAKPVEITMNTVNDEVQCGPSQPGYRGETRSIARIGPAVPAEGDTPDSERCRTKNEARRKRDEV